MLTHEQTRLALEEIARTNNGTLLPESVVEAASSPQHPLHDRFDWDDASAAHAHRLDQARRLIRSVRVEVTTETRTVSTVFYVPDPRLPAGESGYSSLPRLRTDEEAAQAALTQEFGRALSALQRAKEVAAGLGIEADVEGLMKQLRRLAGEVPQLRAA